MEFWRISFEIYLVIVYIYWGRPIYVFFIHMLGVSDVSVECLSYMWMFNAREQA